MLASSALPVAATCSRCQVRDRQCSASLGLPTRIRDEDCDVVKLVHPDFEDEGAIAAPEIYGTVNVEHASYAIQMAELAILRVFPTPTLASWL